MSGNNKNVLLRGTSNYIEWHRVFTRNAKDEDVWDLLTGNFKPIDIEPDMNDAKYAVQASTVAAQHTETTPPGALGAGPLPVETPPVIIVLTDGFARFQHDFAQYEKGQKKIKAAFGLIENSVSPIIAHLIRDMYDPVEAYDFLKETYKMSDTVGGRILLARLEDTKLDSTVDSYLEKIIEIREDLLDYGHVLWDYEVATYIFAGIPASFNEFKDQYLNKTAPGDPDFRNLQTLIDELVKEGARRDGAAKSNSNGGQ